MTAIFKKEPELKELKSQLESLTRQINLSLENKVEKENIQLDKDSRKLKNINDTNNFQGLNRGIKI